jgi:hypothetical protein
MQAQLQHAGVPEDDLASSHQAQLNVVRSYSLGSPTIASADNAHGLQGAQRTASGSWCGLGNNSGSLDVVAGLADPSAFQQLQVIRAAQGSEQR